MFSLHRKKRLPFVSLTIFIVGVILCIVIKLYHQYSIVLENIDLRLHSAAGSLELIVTDSMIENAKKKTPMDLIEHENIRNKANTIAKVHNVIYVYAMIKSGDSALFVLSSYIESDITNNIVTDYLDYYIEASPLMLQSFGSSASEIFDSTNDQWGNFRSIYMPRKTRAGTPYLLCADIRMTEVVDYQLRYLVELALSTVFLVLISLPLFFRMRQHK